MYYTLCLQSKVSKRADSAITSKKDRNIEKHNAQTKSKCHNCTKILRENVTSLWKHKTIQ